MKPTLRAVASTNGLDLSASYAGASRCRYRDMALQLHDPLRARLPTTPRLPGTTRTYGYQRVVSTALGLALLTAFLVKVVNALTEPLSPNHGPIWLLVALFVLFAALPIGVLVMSQRLGIHLTDQGIKNVSVDTTSFTPWSDIREFTPGPAPSLAGNLAVHIVHNDGSTTPLTRFGEWRFWQGRTEAMCDALNRELEFERSRGASSAARINTVATPSTPASEDGSTIPGPAR